MNDNLCIVCGSPYKKSKLKGLIECTNCSFITTNLNISNDELKKLYSIDYFHGKEYSDYLSDKKIIQHNFYSRLKTLMKYIQNPKEKSLFEIGCAYGFFLDVANPLFSDVSGIDISAEAVQKGKELMGLNVFSGDFLEYKFDSKYDVFCMWDTIEHLKEPHLFIEKISENINKDGLIAISTGDIGSLNASIRGDNWRQIHPPTHLQYFSSKTLAKLLEKYGFEVVYTGHPGNYLSLNTISYILFVLKYNIPGFYNLLKKTGIVNLNVYLNMFDFVYMIGRKK
ncbi:MULTISPECIES: class I SAM-dependent methyltransferase [unclassified Paenibacillus]|uniref:class I SAM-dependent methyltransferase n=1 Tax=unclassified Paenibacillus TaxID=185978 RepID=UPI00363FEF42